MLGILDDVTKRCSMAFAGSGDDVFLLGSAIEQPAGALAGSEYLTREHGIVGGRLNVDLGLEERVQRTALAAIKQGLAIACHDCSDGGLAVALAEMALAGERGLDAASASLGTRLDAALFGEAQSRILVSIRPESRAALQQIAAGLSVPMERIGRVSEDKRFRLGPIDLPLNEIKESYEGGLERALEVTPLVDNTERI